MACDKTRSAVERSKAGIRGWDVLEFPAAKRRHPASLSRAPLDGQEIDGPAPGLGICMFPTKTAPPAGPIQA